MSFLTTARLRRSAVIGLMLATVTVCGAATLTAAHAEGACTPQAHPDAITSLLLSDTTLQGGQTVRVDFSGSIPNGSCSGDTVVLVAPPNFPLRDGASPLRDADGVQLGVMTVASNTVTISFNEYVETHDNVTFHGHFYANLKGSQPDTAYDLSWDLGDGRTISTPVTTNSCVGCSDPRTKGQKAAALTTDHEVHVYFDSAPTSGAGQVVTFTDVLGPGQRMDCTRFSGWIGSLTSWGNLSLNGGQIPVTVLACDDAGFTATMTATGVGQYLDLQAYAFTTEDLPTYNDAGTVTQDGHTDQVSASAREYTAGAEGSGDLITDDEEQPTPTPTVPGPTETPSVPGPTETPSVPGPTETPSVPGPTETPSVPGPTETAPTTTPAPVPPATGSPSPTTPTTDATPVPPRYHDPVVLPDTGANALLTTVAAGGITMLAAGTTLVCTARRRRANPS